MDSGLFDRQVSCCSYLSTVGQDCYYAAYGKNYSKPGRHSESSRMCLEALTKYLVASCCLLSISHSTRMIPVSLITSAAHYYLSQIGHDRRYACQDE
jgi:hypothetical protein